MGHEWGKISQLVLSLHPQNNKLKSHNNGKRIEGDYSRSKDYSQWYLDVVIKADLARTQP